MAELSNRGLFVIGKSRSRSVSLAGKDKVRGAGPSEPAKRSRANLTSNESPAAPLNRRFG